jgi:hypothetical protein
MVGIPGTAPGTGQRRAAWAWVAVAVSVLDTIAVAAALVIAAEASIYLPIVETGTWINLVAGPAFPLLAAFMLRNRGRDPDRPRHQDRLAWLFLGFGAPRQRDRGIQPGRPRPGNPRLFAVGCTCPPSDSHAALGGRQRDEALATVRKEPADRFRLLRQPSDMQQTTRAPANARLKISNGGGYRKGVRSSPASARKPPGRHDPGIASRGGRHQPCNLRN